MVLFENLFPIVFFFCSDSDDSGDVPPTPVPSGPPPPPLRGIPHFNPNSPLSSQLTSLPLIPSSMNRPASASRVTSSKTSLISHKKLSSTSLSQGPVQTAAIQSIESISSGDSPILDGDVSTENQLDNNPQQAPKVPLVRASIPKVKRMLFPTEDTTSSSSDVHNKPDINNTTNSVDLKPNETKSVSLTEHVGPPLDNNLNQLSAIPTSKPPLPKITQVIPSLPKTQFSVKSQTSTKHPNVSPVPMDISSTPQTSSQVRVPSIANHKRDSQHIQEHSVPLVSPSYRDVQANLLNVQRSRRMEEGSESAISDTSSSLTISSDSEEELSDEARDHFNPSKD